jgi:hypothetical protein
MDDIGNSYRETAGASGGAAMNMNSLGNRPAVSSADRR